MRQSVGLCAGVNHRPCTPHEWHSGCSATLSQQKSGEAGGCSGGCLRFKGIVHRVEKCASLGPPGHRAPSLQLCKLIQVRELSHLLGPDRRSLGTMRRISLSRYLQTKPPLTSCSGHRGWCCQSHNLQTLWNISPCRIASWPYVLSDLISSSSSSHGLSDQRCITPIQLRSILTLCGCCKFHDCHAVYRDMGWSDHRGLVQLEQKRMRTAR